MLHRWTDQYLPLVISNHYLWTFSLAPSLCHQIDKLDVFVCVQFFFCLCLHSYRYHSSSNDRYRNQRVSVQSYRHFVGLRENAKWSKRTHLGISSSGGNEEVAGFGITWNGIATATIDSRLCQDPEISSANWWVEKFNELIQSKLTPPRRLKS